MTKPQLLRRAQKIKLIAMDVDGVLTNGDVIVLHSGEEIKAWSAKDRLCLALMRDMKLPHKIAWITGRSSKNVELSAADLGVHYLVQKCQVKKDAVAKVINELGISWDETAFIGDDLIDLPPMLAAGFSACPADAVADVRKHAKYISPVDGGRGAVRDVLEFILRAQKKWDALISPFLR